MNIQKIKKGMAPSMLATVFFENLGVRWYNMLVADAAYEDNPEEALKEWLNYESDLSLSVGEYLGMYHKKLQVGRWKNPEWWQVCLVGRSMAYKNNLWGQSLTRFCRYDFDYLNELIFV